MSDSDNYAAAQLLWSQAHKLSCTNRASFLSSVQTTYDDAITSSLPKADIENDAIHRVREIMEVKCALVEADGSIVNFSEDTTFTSAMPMNNCPTPNDCQLKTIANLAAAYLNTNNTNRRQQQQPPDFKPAMQNTTWMEYVTSPLRKVSNGLSHAIDSVLGDPYARTLNSIEDGSELDDEAALSNTIPSETDKDDDETAKKKEGGVMANHRPLSYSDDLYSLEAIASSCRGLLTYVTASHSDVEKDFFVLRDNDGAVDRILLVRNSRGKGSFTSLCHESGKYYSDNHSSNDVELCDASRILSSVSNEQEVKLMIETLVASNHAIIDEDAIVLFPNQIAHNYTKNKSDHALFQIHTTRISIQNRMIRLEQAAQTAQQNAVTAKRNDMTKLALTHMKRRKAAVEELERCASLLSNLDASELRLQRAKDDAQLVQTFASLKTALQDIRTGSGMDETNVDELMSDIQEEMEATNLSSLYGGAIGPDIDEDELNEEFRMLELECANEKYLEDDTNALQKPGGNENDELDCAHVKTHHIETDKANVHEGKSRKDVATEEITEKRLVPLPD